MSRNIEAARHALRVIPLATTRATRSGGVVPCYHAWRAYSSSPEDSDASGPRRRTVTKKKFTELPAGFTLPNGTLAQPMPEWSGGLEDPQGYGPTVTRDNFLDSVEGAVAAEKATRKRRSSKRTTVLSPPPTADSPPLHCETNGAAASSASGDGLSVAAGLESVPGPVKPRRGRKPRTAPPISNDAAEEEEAPTLGPRNQLGVEILDNLRKFPHCILLTRVGQFYESYFDQAVEVSRLLNIKLAQRTWGGRRVFMCGFPLLHLDKYLKVLVQQGNRFVAICEEFPKDPLVGLKAGFERRVTRVITPGTLIDESFLNPYENNFLMAVGVPEQAMKGASNVTARDSNNDNTSIGLAWIDISTGEFFTKSSTLETLQDDIVRVGPREVVLDESFATLDEHAVRQIMKDENQFVSFLERSDDEPVPPVWAAINEGEDNSDNDGAVSSTPASSHTLSTVESLAVDLLTSFLRVNMLEHMPATLARPSRETARDRMQIDGHTIKALEIREGMREGGTTGSLLNVVNRTTTSGGSRLLARWLCSPSTSLKEIHARQSLVALLHARPYLRKDLLQILTSTEDISRIVQKFLAGKGSATDLSAVAGAIRTWSAIRERIEHERRMERVERGEVFVEEEWESVDLLLARLVDLRELARTIGRALHGQQQGSASLILEEGEQDVEEDSDSFSAALLKEQEESSVLNTGKQEWIINPSFSERLKELHQTLGSLLAARESLERRLQREYDVPSLTLRSSPGQGMFVHLARAKRDLPKLRGSSLFVQLTESGSTATFFLQEWAHLGNSIIETTTLIYAEEKAAFESIRNEINSSSDALRRNARITDELDVTIAFAELAVQRNLVRPTITDDLSYEIIDGRHPTVEMGLLKSGQTFTANSLLFTPDSRLHMITGPNMAGKSTYLRQNALITILAQIGSFVPASYAKIGIVDQLFSRVGAKDDLFRGRSTFMVEMIETAEILKRATPKSLIIMDEVGRGTTMMDGLAIAYATIHHLVTHNRCRALFATHFHELSSMLGYDAENGTGTDAFSCVNFFCTDVDETTDGHFSYSHIVKPGVNRNSHGLKVAQIAGMPKSVVDVATATLDTLRTTATMTNYPSNSI